MQLLQLPVQLHGIRLGRPVDLLLDVGAWRVLGFVVYCGDESRRFLAYAAADPQENEIAVPSALLLLEDVEFYSGRSRSLRALLGGVVAGEGQELGELRDVLVAGGGLVDALLVQQDDGLRRVEPVGASIGGVPTV